MYFLLIQEKRRDSSPAARSCWKPCRGAQHKRRVAGQGFPRSPEQPCGREVAQSLVAPAQGPAQQASLLELPSGHVPPRCPAKCSRVLQQGHVSAPSATWERSSAAVSTGFPTTTQCRHR